MEKKESFMEMVERMLPSVVLDNGVIMHRDLYIRLFCSKPQYTMAPPASNRRFAELSAQT